MILKYAAVVFVLLVISFTLSYLSEFNSSGRDIVYNITGSKNQPEQFYEIWFYIGGAIGLILIVSTLVYKIKKNN